MNSQPIGVFDSGLGGLTVLRALRARMPAEHFLYYADTHFLPYGDRPESFIRERGLAIAQDLVAQGVKAIVIACNTATAAAAETIRAACHLPVIALEPAIKPAVETSRTGRIVVMATTRTLASERFKRLVHTYAGDRQIFPIPCPGLAEAIEQHGPDSVAVRQCLAAILPTIDAADPDVVVLGCTHYPWVRPLLANHLGVETTLVDTAEAVAKQVERRLAPLGPIRHAGTGSIHLQTSGSVTHVQPTVERLWGEPITVTHRAITLASTSAL